MTDFNLTLIPRKPGDSKYFENVIIKDPSGWIIGTTHIDSFWQPDNVDLAGEKGGNLYKRLRKGHELIVRLTLVGGSRPEGK